MSAPERIPDLDPLSRALAELPRERAGDGFTGRVLARAAAAEPERGGWPRGAVAAAAALVLVCGATAWRLERAQRMENYRGEVQNLQSEHHAIAQELRDLRAAEKPPLVYLGTNDRVDYYIDLAELQRLQAAAKAAAQKSKEQMTGDTI
jgi:hypothetical protein